MKSKFIVRILTWILCLSVLTALPLNALAATTLTYNGVSVSIDNATVTDGVISATATGTTTVIISNAKSISVKITNSNDYAVILRGSMSISCSGGSGSYTIGSGSSVSVSDGSTATYSEDIEIAAGGSVTIKITSPKGANKTTTLEYAPQIIKNASYAVTFNNTAEGSYTVGGSEVSFPTTQTINAISGVALKVTPTSTEQVCIGFADATTGKLVCGVNVDQEATFYPTAACTIVPVYMAKPEAAPFTVGSSTYYTWESAFTAANGAIVILNQDYTLPIDLAGNGMSSNGNYVTAENGVITYTIPTGGKLLVPYCSDDSGNFSSTISSATTTDKDRTPYATLTVPGTGKLNVLGSLNVNGVQREADTGATSTVSGEYGHVALSDGAVLSVGSNAALYCYGYITGDGYVEALNGSSVYEILQIGDWKGGTASMNWEGDSSTNKVFAFSQYFIQNIEADYYIYSGAQEYVSTYVQSLGCLSAEGFGKKGFFVIDGGRVLRNYDATEDRVSYTLQNSTEVSFQGIEISYQYTVTGSIAVTKTFKSAESIFNLPNNMTFHAENGSKVNFENNIRMLPGAEFIVDEGANLNVNANLYIYGTTEWMSGKYCDTAYYARSAYSATLGGTPTRVVSNSTPSAKLVINGTMTVTGGVFTSGAVGGTTDPDKVITGTGKIINSGTVESRVITEYTRVGTSVEPHEIQFQPAVARLAGLTTSDADYDNLSASTADAPYIGLGDYWYTTTVTVTGAVDQIADAQIKDNGDGTYTLYATTQARLALNSGYAAYQNDAVLSSTVTDGIASYVTTDLTTAINIAAAETVDVTVVMMGDEGVTRSFTLAVVSGTTVSGYYTDAACTTAATTVSGGETLYAKAVAWIEWDNGDPDTYYTDFMEAMRAATNGAGELHLLASVQNTMSHHVAAGQSLKMYLNGRTITYISNLLDIYGDMTLDMEGGKIINYYKPIDELTATTTTTTDDEGNEVTTTTYDTAATAACALRTRSGGTLNLIVNGGSLGWEVPESYITDYGYVFSSTSYVTPLYNYAGGTMNVDLSSGEIYVDHPGVLSYSDGTYMLDVISNRGAMTVTGKGDGNGVIWSNAYCDATSYANSGGTSCRVTTAIHNYGTSGSLTLNGVMVNSINENASYIASIYSYHGATLTLQNTTINAVKGYAVMNRGGTITEVADCTINCYSGIYSLYNSSYSASVGTIGGNTTINSSDDYGIYNRGSVDTIGGNTTINATGTYGIYNRGSIDTIGGENANVSITGLYYGIYLHTDGEIDLIGGKNATVAISQTSAGASKKYYAPIRIAAGGRIGIIGVDASDTDNTQTTITLTAKAYYGIYAAGDGEVDSIGTIGGPKANVTIKSPRYGVHLTSNGSIGTIGAGNDTVTLHSTGSYYGLYLAATSSVDTIGGGSGSTVTLSGPYKSCYVAAGATIDTIGTNGSTVNFKATNTGSKTRNNLYVYGTVNTIGGAGSTVNFTGAYGYDGDAYGICVNDGGTVGVIGDTNSTVTLTGKSRNTTYYYRGIYVGEGSTVGTIGSAGATITITDTAPTKGGFGIFAANGTINSIGNGANITIKAYNGITAGSTTAGNVGTITTIGSDSGSINITASYSGISTIRNYLGTGTIGTICGNVHISSSKYGIYSAGVIRDLADDLVVVTTGGTDCYAVHIAEASTTTVTETSTDADGNEVSTDVVYDVPAGSVDLVSGGKYYHASGRDYIFSAGANKMTYVAGKLLSTDTQSVTLFTGTEYNCYYITDAAAAIYSVKITWYQGVSATYNPEQTTYTWSPADLKYTSSTTPGGWQTDSDGNVIPSIMTVTIDNTDSDGAVTATFGYTPTITSTMTGDALTVAAGEKNSRDLTVTPSGEPSSADETIILGTITVTLTPKEE